MEYYAKPVYNAGMSLFILSLFLLISCEKPPEGGLGGGTARSAVVQEGHDEEELAIIAEDARDALTGFFRHLTRPGKGEGQFCIKYPFPADDGSGVKVEQLWLTGIHFKNGLYYGVVANNPQYMEGVKKGDTINIEMDSITDWMYVRNGKIVGGYSIKYLLEKIPESQLGVQDRALLQMFY